MQPQRDSVKVTIRRCDPASGRGPFDQTYEVPVGDRTTVIEALDYIYENIDPSLAYYDHAACGQGICRRCTAAINGKVSYLCLTRLTADVTIAPPAHLEIVRDLVCKARVPGGRATNRARKGR